MKRKQSLYGDGAHALTPKLKAFTGPVTSAQVASLESRLNGQQARIEAQEAFIKELKWEQHNIRSAFRLLGKPLGPSPSPRMPRYENRIATLLPHEMEQK